MCNFKGRNLKAARIRRENRNFLLLLLVFFQRLTLKLHLREYLRSGSIKYLHFKIAFNVFSNVNLDTFTHKIRYLPFVDQI